jgi:hypothetical protein
MVLTMLVCAACGPLATFRPASALLDSERTAEVGAGVVALSPRPYVEESTRVTGQLWGTLEAAEWLKLSAIGAFDDEAAVGGLEAMAVPLHTYRVAAGVGVEAGFAWAGISLPLAVRPFEPVWIYSSPALRTWGDGKEFLVGVPLGVSVSIASWLDVRAEAQVSWAEFKSYNRRVHYGLAAAHSF